MQRLSRFLLMAIVLALPLVTQAQQEPDLAARRRLFPEIGAGVLAIRRGPAGQYFILVAPGKFVQVFDAAGKKIGQVPAQAAGAAAIVFGVAMDVDAAGRVFVADRGGNAVNVYGADGALLAHVKVSAPMAVAALSGDEFAVCSLTGNSLIAVYDFQGALLRQFGELAGLVDDPQLDHRLSLGQLLSDAAGNLYFAFDYMPEPTVREYDRFGYLIDDVSLTTPDMQPAAQSARREIARAAQGAVISPHQIISALGVDPAGQDVWIAIGDRLLRVDRNGQEAGGSRTYTEGNVRITPSMILVEPNRLLFASDPLGIYEFPRPDSSAKTP
jgi:hypothetical protein